MGATTRVTRQPAKTDTTDENSDINIECIGIPQLRSVKYYQVSRCPALTTECYLRPRNVTQISAAACRLRVVTETWCRPNSRWAAHFLIRPLPCGHAIHEQNDRFCALPLLPSAGAFPRRSAGMIREAPTRALLLWFRGGLGVVSGPWTRPDLRFRLRRSGCLSSGLPAGSQSLHPPAVPVLSSPSLPRPGGPRA